MSLNSMVAIFRSLMRKSPVNWSSQGKRNSIAVGGQRISNIAVGQHLGYVAHSRRLVQLRDGEALRPDNNNNRAPVVSGDHRRNEEDRIPTDQAVLDEAL